MNAFDRHSTDHARYTNKMTIRNAVS